MEYGIEYTLIKGYRSGCVLLVRAPHWMPCLLLPALWPCMDARAGIPENLQDFFVFLHLKFPGFLRIPEGKTSRECLRFPDSNKPNCKSVSLCVCVALCVSV